MLIWITRLWDFSESESEGRCETDGKGEGECEDKGESAVVEFSGIWFIIRILWEVEWSPVSGIFLICPK